MTRKKLKLFVWDGVLEDWSGGLAVAYAYTVEEAVEMLKKELSKDHFDGTKFDGVEPEVFDGPTTAWCFGGG